VDETTKKGADNTLNETKEVEGLIRYEQDSKRYHRFQIETEDDDIVGTVYIPKTMNPLPDKLVLTRKRN
jgi:hypothetical protein